MAVKNKLDVVSIFDDFENDYDVRVSDEIVEKCKEDISYFAKHSFLRYSLVNFVNFTKKYFNH